MTQHHEVLTHPGSLYISFQACLSLVNSEQYGTKPKLEAKILATNFDNNMCFGYQDW